MSGDGCASNYPPGTDVPHFDLSTGAERAIEWLSSLRERQLVSTESRLMMVFELLRQMAEGTVVDPEERIVELERRKAKLEREIELVREGRWQVMDPAQVKDRFLQMAATARGLLSDFREVDQNFPRARSRRARTDSRVGSGQGSAARAGARRARCDWRFRSR